MRWFLSCYTPRSHFERQVFDDALESSTTRIDRSGAEDERFGNTELAKMLKKKKGGGGLSILEAFLHSLAACHLRLLAA